MRKRSFILGIAGGSGSGKSWLARQLAQNLRGRVLIVQSDWYYRDRSGVRGAARLRINFDHPRAIEVPLLARHLAELAAGMTVKAPQYDYATHRRLSRALVLKPRPILVIEGLFVLHERSIWRLLDHGIYLDVPDSKRLRLRLERDQAARSIERKEVLRLYQTFVRPMHRRYVAPSRKRAHLIWKGLPNLTLVKSIAARIKCDE